MKKILLVMAVMFLAACSRVPAGHVGIKVQMLGSDKGVGIEELTPGRHWIGFNEELHLFPTFTQNYTWENTKESNEELGFQSVEGMDVTADVGISYSIDPDKAPLIFQKYRKGVDEITDLYLRNMVRDSLVSAASKMPVEKVYGVGKTELISIVQSDVAAQVKPLGINIEKIYWIGKLRLPPQVTASINAKIEATQKAMTRENELQTAAAEAQIVRETARGKADAILISAKAQAEANNIISESIDDRLLQYKSIETWDGKLPQVTGSSGVPLINIK